LSLFHGKKSNTKAPIFEEMDVDAILSAPPASGSGRRNWPIRISPEQTPQALRGLQELLGRKNRRGVTLNIQHIESIAPVVRSITGITVRETVPDWVPLTAAETVMVDLTPEACQNRMKRGDVYSSEKVARSLKNFFRRGILLPSASSLCGRSPNRLTAA